jgi:predicted transcriptional regulator
MKGDEIIRLKTGDIVRVRPTVPTQEWVEGVVTIASSNGQSVMISLDSAVRTVNGTYINMLPLSIDYAAQTVTDLFGGNECEIEVAGE